MKTLTSALRSEDTGVVVVAAVVVGTSVVVGDSDGVVAAVVVGTAVVVGDSDVVISAGEGGAREVVDNLDEGKEGVEVGREVVGRDGATDHASGRVRRAIQDIVHRREGVAGGRNHRFPLRLLCF